MTFSTQSKLLHGTTRVLPRAARRGGFTITELIVAATLLVVSMSVVASLTVSAGRLRQDARHHRLALDELSNQLERLTSLDKTSRVNALAELAPSPQMLELLPNPVISAETLSDESGTRLVMHLVWDRLGKGNPVTLVGWVDPLSASEVSARDEETP